MKKKLIVTLSLISLLNISLFASTTIVHSPYYNDGPSPLINDIYSSLMLSGYYADNIDENSVESYSANIGVNVNGSVFFMESPVGLYYSVDLVPTDADDTYFIEGMFAMAIRANSNSIKESYINIGPAVSIYTQDDSLTTIEDPFTLVYWGAGINAGYRMAFPSVKSFAFDLGVSAKALWFDEEISILGSLASSSPKDFRYALSGYIGFTYRWFAPNWGDEDVNVILAL